ncbi:unnamed protein product, partial [Rotaria sp. Silwood2]
MCSSWMIVELNVKSGLPNLTTFSFTSTSPAEEYDNLIVSTLGAMSNIEKQDLYRHVEKQPEFIDNDDLYDDILIYMPRINFFLISQQLTIMSTSFIGINTMILKIH